MTQKTPIYQLEYLVPGDPIRVTRAVMERNTKAIETALAAKAVAPPLAGDLVTLSGRTTALEQAALYTGAAPYANKLWKPGVSLPNGSGPALTFANSWAQDSSALATNPTSEIVAIMRDRDGRCYLQGTILGGGTSAVALTLPHANFRPAARGQRYYNLFTERTDTGAIGNCMGIVRSNDLGTDIYIHNPNGVATVTKVHLAPITFQAVLVP